MHPIIPLLQLVHLLQRIEGRKKLQKAVHILKELGAPFPEPFEYSSYGMYSLQLKNEVGVLESEQLVREQPMSGYGGNPTYVIEAGPELEKLIAEFDLTEPPIWADLAKRLNAMTPQKLEGISTILFLRRTESEGLMIRQRLLSLKPHLTGIADACFEEVEHLPRVA